MSPRSQIVWTPLKDDLLMETMANGATFVRAGHAVGVNKDQAASRFKRLKERLGWQAR